MKNNPFIVLFLFCSIVLMGQVSDRELFRALAVNDTLAVESGFVLNSTSKVKTAINPQGYFEIQAKSKDTLIISSDLYQFKRWVVADANSDIPVVKIKLQLLNHQLKEVVVNQKKVASPIVGNTQKYVDGKYFDDAQSSPTNSTVPSFEIVDGLDFVRIGKLIGKLFKKAENKEEGNQTYDFVAEVPKRLSSNFFYKELLLLPDQVALFLFYCDNDKRSKSILNSENEFFLIDFLITKNNEFKTIRTFEK